MSKKKVVKTAPIIEQFADLASTQRELADELGAKFLEFCNEYLNEECVLTRSEFSYQNFLPTNIDIEAYTKKPTASTTMVDAYIGNVHFRLNYDYSYEEYDDDHFKDELIKFLNK
ncbi:hypothetical protein B9N63_05210 [Campylobacter concisus]|uniref:hypothetical protein n=1 Tax=Campylobacter concisus TaxID=199 RepID=UPI000B3D7AAD|nr:hypothetical protein [Campylobacter concisus]OUT13848.1 hypothetical protein B9N63_05210 [Campylobacter concisus]